MSLGVFAAAEALDASASAVGTTGVVVAVVGVLLGVAAMFGVLFWGKWAKTGDATGVVEQRRRERLNQNPAYSG